MGEVESGITEGSTQPLLKIWWWHIVWESSGPGCCHIEGMVSSDHTSCPARRLDCSTSDLDRDLTRETPRYHLAPQRNALVRTTDVYDVWEQRPPSPYTLLSFASWMLVLTRNGLGWMGTKDIPILCRSNWRGSLKQDIGAVWTDHMDGGLERDSGAGTNRADQLEEGNFKGWNWTWMGLRMTEPPSIAQPSNRMPCANVP